MRTEFDIKALCIGWLRGGWSLTWPVRCLMGPVWSRYSSFSLCSTFFRFVYSCYDYWKWKLFVAHIIIFLTYGHRTALRTRYVWFPVNISYLVLHINMLERTACPLCRYLVNRDKIWMSDSTLYSPIGYGHGILVSMCYVLVIIPVPMIRFASWCFPNPDFTFS